MKNSARAFTAFVLTPPAWPRPSGRGSSFISGLPTDLSHFSAGPLAFIAPKNISKFFMNRSGLAQKRWLLIKKAIASMCLGRWEILLPCRPKAQSKL